MIMIILTDLNMAIVTEVFLLVMVIYKPSFLFFFSVEVSTITPPITWESRY